MIARIFAVLATIFVMLWLASLALIQPARAQQIPTPLPPMHDITDPRHWLPFRCCSFGRDCQVYAIEDVRVTQDGYFLPEFGQTILFTEANTSPDENYHLCRTHQETPTIRAVDPSNEPMMNRSGRCFWAPEGAM